MAYLDGELSKDARKEFESLLDAHPEWREQVQEMAELVEGTQHLRLRPPDREVWDHYWEEIDSRLQRRFGWVVALIGSLALIGWGIVKVLLYAENNVVLFGIVLVLIGLVTLFVSVLRGRLLEMPRDRYRRIRR